MSGALSIGLYKEARALSTTWALAAAALVAMSWWGARLSFELGIAAYVAGAVFLGAESIGQEYTHRTLSVLLAQPIDRRWVYLQKFVVLIVMLLMLAALQWVVRGDEWRQLADDRRINVWLLPIVGGAFMAPWLTMVSRSSLGGAALTCIAAIGRIPEETGGEAGIRTLVRTLKVLKRFSKPPPSATRPPHRARANHCDTKASPQTK
jgi:hypothetical protein